MNTIFNQSTNTLNVSVIGIVEGADPETEEPFAIPPWGSVKVGYSITWSNPCETLALRVEESDLLQWAARDEVTTVVTFTEGAGWYAAAYKSAPTQTPESEMLAGIGQGINYGIGIFAIGFIMFLIKRHPMNGGANVERDL